MKMKKLLAKVKANLILEHDEDDEFLIGCIAAAVSYAESYQHRAENYYMKRGSRMSAATEQGVIMLASHFYESRDGGTGGFFSEYIGSVPNIWTTVNRLLSMGKDYCF